VEALDILASLVLKLPVLQPQYKRSLHIRTISVLSRPPIVARASSESSTRTSDRTCDSSTSPRAQVCYYMHTSNALSIMILEHFDNWICPEDLLHLRVFHQKGKVFWFSCREDARSEILQENNAWLGGYKEVGIKPDDEGYHVLSVWYEDRQVHLRVNRTIGFLMGVPNNTGESDDWIMTRLEVVSNHKNGRRSDNYCEYHFIRLMMNLTVALRQIHPPPGVPSPPFTPLRHLFRRFSSTPPPKIHFRINTVRCGTFE
jgi:hypothetical protein